MKDSNSKKGIQWKIKLSPYSLLLVSFPRDAHYPQFLVFLPEFLTRKLKPRGWLVWDDLPRPRAIYWTLCSWHFSLPLLPVKVSNGPTDCIYNVRNHTLCVCWPYLLNRKISHLFHVILFLHNLHFTWWRNNQNQVLNTGQRSSQEQWLWNCTLSKWSVLLNQSPSIWKGNTYITLASGAAAPTVLGPHWVHSQSLPCFPALMFLPPPSPLPNFTACLLCLHHSGIPHLQPSFLPAGDFGYISRLISCPAW